MKHPDLLRLEALRMAVSISASKYQSVEGHDHGRTTNQESHKSCDDVLKDARKMLNFLKG